MVLLASNFDKSKYLEGRRSRQGKEVSHQERDRRSVGMGDDKEHKLVLWFTNDERGLVLNRTNIRVLREAFGDDRRQLGR